MGLPVTVYRWDDAGAPALSTSVKPSEIIDVLKKVLVDGYGSKAGLGWTVDFEDAANFKIVFKNSTSDGSGGVFSLKSTSGADTVIGIIRLQGAQSATDVDTLINPGFYSQLKPDASNTKWIVIGTSRSFYMFLCRNSLNTYNLGSGNEPAFFAGDIDPLIVNDSSAFSVMVQPNTLADAQPAQWNYSLTYMMAIGDSSFCGKFYETDGGNTWKTYKWRKPFSSGLSLSSVANPNTQYFAPAVIEAVTPSDVDSSGLPTYASVKMPIVRGKMPGILISSLNCDGDGTWPRTTDIGGVSHYVMRSYASTQIHINEESWYE